MHAVGLDLTGSTIRYVRIRQRGIGKYELRHFGGCVLPAGIIHDGELLDRTKLAEILKSMFSIDTKQHIHKPRAVYTSIPERHSFLKLLTIVHNRSDSVDEAVRWESTQHIPYELKDLAMDWERVPDESTNSIKALVAACPTSVASSYDNVLHSAGYQTLSVELPSLALYRAFSHQLNKKGIEMLVQLGELESFALVVKDGVPALSSLIHVTTQSLQQLLEKRFSIATNDSLRALLTIGLYKLRARGVVRDVLIPSIDLLASRIREIGVYCNDYLRTTQPIGSVIVCGAGSTIAGLTEELADRLRLDVKCGSLPSSLKVRKQATDFNRFFQPFSIALGLALRAT